ncbi:19592_t:CDS:2 [Funneliformis geosporum]|uniref:2716_t:CDS:1 n=1 Tax=Funneliformis geosporum TaxID=1117311 RepID=A0A9W4SWI5_9GLOM|nr:19592_t:CDS:2 [Funneliformis geosporum]CAI2181634.1 2716_t:CDS:2 [Funneliformis geosporum]
MVKVEEITEDYDDDHQSEDSNFTTDDSDSEDDFEDETWIERIRALRDIVPTDTRESITYNISSIMSFGVRSARFLGNGAWILTTSALLVVFPLLIEIGRESAINQMESEQMLNQGDPYGQPGQPGQPLPPGQHLQPGQHQAQPRGALIPPGF